ncbi:hypothetical protein Forpe1208_v011246 [Fusarium oxysporum f. sp. rapae]|uniref:DUF7908 domain-containing protein n=1 Tax=Fusarium oxysporum f. sp. rapae TaxID=485398 RepID=A0A8J5U4M1_FUSOX|nr:hypothetical protein Forpe1208_v011246 [Fusarium oxysporum f. sp. rapae]
MKHQVFIATFLTAFHNVAGKQLAPVKLETWCITYVSTYFVPLHASSNLTEIGEATKYTGLAPTLDATTAENASSIANQLDSSASETQLADVEPTEPQSDTDTTAEATDDTIIAPTTIVEADLTSTSKTAPASSSFNDPAGQSIIFLISILDNDKRDLGKRATGGFVGNENPGVCTFAAVFTLSDDLLLENGVPIYYSGEEYKELSGQRQPPRDAVTRTFSTSGGGLQFANAKLPGGQAGFCQDSSGKVYITFSSGPPGCVPVDLLVYGGCHLNRRDTRSIPNPLCIANRLHISRGFHFVKLLNDRKHRHCNNPLWNDDSFIALLVYYNQGLATVVVLGFLRVFSSSQLWGRGDTVADGDGSATSQNISDETSTSTDSSEKTTSSNMSTEPGTSASTNDVPQTSTTGDITSEVPSTTMDASTTEPTTIPAVDACVSGITSPDGEPPLDVREEECSDLNVVTVSPATVTVTEVRKRRVVRGIIVAEHVMPVTRNVAPRDDDDAATTVFPTQTPEYATYCDSADEYYDACSSLGVTRFTTTLSTETETTTDIITTFR